VESFNGRLRDEYLNEHWFQTLVEVRKIVKAWWDDHDTVRRHSSLGSDNARALSTAVD
jgi:putative transposase